MLGEPCELFFNQNIPLFDWILQLGELCVEALASSSASLSGRNERLECIDTHIFYSSSRILQRLDSSHELHLCLSM